MKRQQLIATLLLLGGTKIFCITPKDIYVQNNIGMNRDVIAAWKKKGTETELPKPIPSNKTIKLTAFDKIKDGSTITFGPGGQLLKLTAGQTTVKKEDLNAEFQKLSPAANDSLIVIVSQGWTSPQVTLTYALHVPQIREAKMKENPFQEFPRLQSYPAILAKLSEKEFEQLGAPESIFIQGYAYLGGAGATTAGDVYRYVLGLSTKPSKADVEEAYKTLALQWHPDKYREEAEKEYAERVFKIIGKAHDELMKQYT